jgi:hypothetical protein
MQDKNDLIRDLTPIAGDFADDYDWDAIADEAGEFDAERGWHLREGIAAVIEEQGYSDELNAIMADHSACGVSVDGGRTTLYPSDRDDIAAMLEEHPLDDLAPFMDDDARERTHLESEWTGTDGHDADWLCDYLRRAPRDLVIG